MRILVFGLPGSGKTTLAKSLSERLDCLHINADEVRAKFEDYDFSIEGRIRQSERMRDLSFKEEITVSDFIAPTEDIRKIFNADIGIWMDTIKVSRFEDTNSIFQTPIKYDLSIRDLNYDIKYIMSYMRRG